VIARWKDRCAASTNAQQALCTDCHGNHRFAKRAIVWDKKTGKLLSASAQAVTASGASLAPAFGKALSGGMAVAGQAEFRQRPITVECWAKLDSAESFNILVASDTKASAEHWELYSTATSGAFSLYQPGRGGDFNSGVNICDGKWHFLAAIIEPERVRLFVDGNLVKDAPATPLTGTPQPGELAFGQLVEGGMGCDGAVDNLRLSRGVRAISGTPAAPLTKDATTLGLWDFDDKPAAGGNSSAGAPATTGLFARTNLVAWCIVPFDAKQRGPEARGQMLEKLGLKKLAYDWRGEHIPTFDAEVAAMKQHGVEMTAWWFPGGINAEARAILDCIKRNDIHPQLWVMLEGGDHLRLDKAFESTPAAQTAHVERLVAQVKPIAAEAAKLGCQVALYNHGGWIGIPENQIEIIQRLKQDGIDNVGMIYTQHHGYGEIDRFAELFPKMQPYLLAISLHGLTKDGDLQNNSLREAPLGQGDEDLRLLRIIKESGWTGPVGIIGEMGGVDVELRLQDQLDGLDWLVPQLDGKAPDPLPVPRAWKKPAPVRTVSATTASGVVSVSAAFGKALRGGMTVEGRTEFRQRPLTVECWAKLDSAADFNILVASDPKASAEHWELYSYAGSGVLSLYQPGRGGEFRSEANICDGKWHYLAAVIEPERVRLFVDGKLVKDAPATLLQGEPMPGDLAFGQLVEGGHGCDGVVDEIRISSGTRAISGVPKAPFPKDAATVGLWNFDELSKSSAPPAG
jgi:sugar phosphate isomerase/epimerase